MKKSDSYTKNEINKNFASKQLVDEALPNYALKSECYTKTEVSKNYALKDEVVEALINYALKTQIEELKAENAALKAKIETLKPTSYSWQKNGYYNKFTERVEFIDLFGIGYFINNTYNKSTYDVKITWANLCAYYKSVGEYYCI